MIASEPSHIDEFCGGIATGKLTYTGEAQLALAKAGPVIFVGPHQWNWKVAPIFYVESGIRVTTIYGKLKHELMNQIILAARQKTGAIDGERGAAIRSVISTLESGGSLCFIIDQRIITGVQVKFFGRDFLMTSFPARLAIKFHCPIVPIDMERLPDHKFHMIFGTPILRPRIPNSQTEQQMTQAIAEQFECTNHTSLTRYLVLQQMALARLASYASLSRICLTMRSSGRCSISLRRPLIRSWRLRFKAAMLIENRLLPKTWVTTSCRTGVDGLQGSLFQVDVPQIVVHEAHEALTYPGTTEGIAF